MISIRMPKNLNDHYVFEFLRQAEIIFDHEGKQTPGVNLRYDRVERMSLFAQLLFYKFISFSSERRCFSSPTLQMNKYVEGELAKSGFDKLIQYYLQKSDEEEKKKKSIFPFFGRKDNVVTREEMATSLHSTFENNFYIAPLRMYRDDPHRIRLETDYIKNIQKFYHYDKDIIEIVSKCLTEIYMNFWEHATIDSGTVMVAKGDNGCFELIFADNGAGIISTLSNCGRYRGRNLIQEAVKRGVTSKPGTSHMGWGLWLVSTLCELNSGKLDIFSEGKYLGVDNKNKIIKECGYWKGTIIYLRLPLNNPKTIAALDWDRPNPVRIRWE